MVEGLKFDTEKVRWDLLPFDAIGRVAEVLTYGARKYAPNNWQHVVGWEWRYFGATLRHLARWRLGERIDPESGSPHLAHAACSVLFLLHLDERDAPVAVGPILEPRAIADGVRAVAIREAERPTVCERGRTTLPLGPEARVEAALNTLSRKLRDSCGKDDIE